MKKRLLIGLLVLIFSLAGMVGTAWANESQLIQTEQIRSQPVNVATYIDNQIDYWGEIILRLLKTGKPVLMFDEGAMRGALSVTAIENVLTDKADLIIGWTLMNEEPAQFFYGLEVNVELSGVLGEIFSRLKPAVYVVDGGFLWGFGFELRAK